MQGFRLPIASQGGAEAPAAETPDLEGSWCWALQGPQGWLLSPMVPNGMRAGTPELASVSVPPLGLKEGTAQALWPDLQSLRGLGGITVQSRSVTDDVLSIGAPCCPPLADKA